MISARRGFLAGAAAFFAAPAIVRVTNLMPVSVLDRWTLNPPDFWMRPDPANNWIAGYWPAPHEEGPDIDRLSNKRRNAWYNEHGFASDRPVMTAHIPSYIEVADKEVPPFVKGAGKDFILLRG